MNEYTVYAKTNPNGYITAVNSSAFLLDTAGWAQIAKGTGDKYHHAQGNYFPLPIITEGGAYRYNLVDGKPAECTAEDIAQQEAANQPEPAPPASGASEDAIWDAMAAAYSEGVQSA